MSDKVKRSEEEWRRLLTPHEYFITREKGTERAYTGEYWDTMVEGQYDCICCGQELFDSTTKFVSHCGWPSFHSPSRNTAVSEAPDHSYGMVRTEVLCSRCDAHLGHVFEDGPPPSGLRYCINSAAIKLRPPKA